MLLRAQKTYSDRVHLKGAVLARGRRELTVECAVDTDLTQEARAMEQCVKCLPHKCEDLSSETTQTRE